MKEFRPFLTLCLDAAFTPLITFSNHSWKGSFFFFNLNKTFLQRIFGELLSAFWSSLEVMVWDPPLCSHTVGTNEQISRATTSTPLSLTSSHALSFSLCSHKHDTKKPEALLFIAHRGRLGLSWMGRIRYALPVCMPALSLSHSEAVLQRGASRQPVSPVLHGRGVVYTSNVLAC